MLFGRCIFFCLSLMFLRLIYASEQQSIQVGAERTDIYIPKIKNKIIGLVVNQTSSIGVTHLVDSLSTLKMNVKAIYAPEHGYKGDIERGLSITNAIDTITGIPVFSLYGNIRKPTPEMLRGIDIMIFDIQDVGVRFFTYISSLHYVMEACAENNIELLILDRPNPLGHYVDGPVLNPAYISFVGMHPVPIVHGMTIGEYANMVNEQGWLKNSITCRLEVITVINYSHHSFYQLPISPSPNLPDMKSIYLYPSICLFEGTNVSEGRGTDIPFQQFGIPSFTPRNHQFIPRSKPGYSMSPKYENQLCFGYDLSDYHLGELQKITQIMLKYLIEFYNKSEDKETFFNNFFDKLAGSDLLRKQIISGKSENEIRKSWEADLIKFKRIRKKYLLYSE